MGNSRGRVSLRAVAFVLAGMSGVVFPVTEIQAADTSNLSFLNTKPIGYDAARVAGVAQMFNSCMTNPGAVAGEIVNAFTKQPISTGPVSLSAKCDGTDMVADVGD